MNPGSWRLDADCIDKPDLFFPGVGQRFDAAKAICAGCDVRSDCLEYALSHHPEFGIWAGYTPVQIHNLRRKRAQAARIAKRSA